jgi:cell division protease FtsH
MAGSEFGGILVGIGAGKVKNLFKEARKLAELEGGCIIFIDEIDAIARPRQGDAGFGAQMDANQTVNQLLTEMDGLKDSDANVVVFGATNIPEEQLDPALMRAGRFDRKIYVDLPNLEDRKKLFAYYLSKVKCDPRLDLDLLARKAVYKSPADIANIVREAALIATRDNREAVTLKDISQAIDRIELGIKHKVNLTAAEKKMMAYHEAGHAIVAYFLRPTDDVFKATIIKRKEYFGMVVVRPRDERFTTTREQFLALIKTSLGGYVAEKLKFKTTADGTYGDLTKVAEIVHDMVFLLGMGPSGLVGNFERFPLSLEIQEKLSNDYQHIISACMKEVEELLTRECNLLDRFASELLKKEELEFDEIDAIFKEYYGVHWEEKPSS